MTMATPPYGQKHRTHSSMPSSRSACRVAMGAGAQGMGGRGAGVWGDPLP